MNQMKKMKKVSLLFAALLLVFTMQGCGRSPQNPDSAADALKIFYETEEAPATEKPGEKAAAETAGETTVPELDSLGADEYTADDTEEEYDELEETEEFEEETEAPEETEENICYISISCGTILDNLDRCDEDKLDFVPGNGVILSQIEAEFEPGESVFDVLQRVCRENGIHMESEWTPMYNSAYIEGIHNLYEFDVGSESGWMYCVNGWFPNFGCSRYEVEPYDDIQWLYTCNLGADVGGANALG